MYIYIYVHIHICTTTGGRTADAASTAKPKKEQKRNPKDEAIKLFGELLRDKEWVKYANPPLPP